MLKNWRGLLNWFPSFCYIPNFSALSKHTLAFVEYHVQIWLVSSQMSCGDTHQTHDDVIKWKHFQRYWPFVRGICRSPVNSPHKAQWRGALMFSLICTLNKRLSKQSGGWWFETPSCSLWRHCNDPWMWFKELNTYFNKIKSCRGN